MRENFLHYLWKYQFFAINKLQTTNKEPLQIYKAGEHNFHAGPDFFNSKIKIGNQIWVGNVEIHVKSSDWYVHGHEKDESYDNVILHVVWYNDVEIYRKNNTSIPTLELKPFVSESMISRHEKLFSKDQKWIHCENFIGEVDTFILNNWLEVMYFERLQQKSEVILELLHKSANDWETVLFQLMAKNFGLKVNGSAFLNLANSMTYKIFRKESAQLAYLEALTFGQAGFLAENNQDTYYKAIQKIYGYQQLKYGLKPVFNGQFKFFRLRPNNFPTIRLAQFAMLYFLQKNLFSNILEAVDLKDYYKIFQVNTSAYWERHYNFNTESPKRVKSVTKSFIHLLLINTIIPLRFVYMKYTGKNDAAYIIDLIKQIPPERNHVVERFESLLRNNSEKDIKMSNALESQAYLQLKTAHCNQHDCLQCAVGNSFLKQL